ncbi:MAG: HAD family hydrolase [Tabrizicola sp.]|nr:HAD family hydrolase [Tabrizicola sp.]
MIDGLLFDKDGTLFDFRTSWGRWTANFLKEIARDTAHATDMARAIGYDIPTNGFAPDSPVIAATAYDIAEALLPHLPGTTHAALTDRINATASTAPMAPAVPLRPLLGGLKSRGLRLGVATNDTEAPARRHLAAHDITDCFDFIAGYDSGHGAKPGPGMCLAFLTRFGLDPRRTAMVGDSLHDLEAGRAAGMRTIAVLTGIAGAETLAPHADIVLSDIGAIPDWLDQL